MLMPDPLPESERAAVGPAVVGSPGVIAACPICGKPLTGRQRSACSDKCRAAKSRREQARKLTERECRVQTYLLTAQEALWAAREAMKGR